MRVMIGKRVCVREGDMIRYGVIIDCLSKEDTAGCMMYDVWSSYKSKDG